MIRSITSSGLMIPLDQKVSQTPSILLLSTPVITLAILVTDACTRVEISNLLLPGGSKATGQMSGVPDSFQWSSASTARRASSCSTRMSPWPA